MINQINLNVNGKSVSVAVEPQTTLLEVLRDELKLSRTKEGCNVGECGSCAVLIDGKTMHSCLVLAIETAGKEITTCEAMQKTDGSPVQEQLIDQAAIKSNVPNGGKGKAEEILTFCQICAGHCSVKVTVQDGKFVDMEPDARSGLPNEQCPVKKGRFSVPEILSHPDRLKYPLKRMGKRGEGKWQRISWDEALDTVAARLGELKAKYGPETVSVALGEPKGLEFAFGQRFASAFGTPNVATPAFFCGSPTVQAFNLTFGLPCVPDEATRPELIVFWGINPNHTGGGIRRENISTFIENGSKVLTVDPVKTDVASLSDLWLRVRPGSDGALAMGWLKVIIEEDLYDKEFVANSTVGFDRLKEHVKTFSLEEVEKATWIPADQIRQAARMYAQSKPAVIQSGNALDQVAGAFQTLRALSILRAITGNLNVPGGDIFLTPPPYTRPGRFFLLSKFPRDPKKTVGGEYKVGIRSAFIPAHSLIKAINEGKPYPIRAVLFMLTNPLISYPDSNETYKALMNLEFSVVLDIFMSPTAALADIVLPSATGMEHDDIGYWPGWYEEVRAHSKAVEPPGEARPNSKIINELARRLGLEEYFWKNDEEALEFWLQPSGISFDDLRKRKTLLPKREYKQEFRTPSGKVEIYSKQLEELGYSPMPLWQEIAQIPQPPAEYPLLLTNAKEPAFMLSGYMMIAGLRNIKPEPTVGMHPDTAQKLGLKDGDMVYLETKKGRITQRLYLDSDLDPRVVNATFGWWFPEEGPSSLYGWRRSNLNIITDNEPPIDKETGSKQIRGIPCRVYKA